MQFSVIIIYLSCFLLRFLSAEIMSSLVCVIMLHEMSGSVSKGTKESWIQNVKEKSFMKSKSII